VIKSSTYSVMIQLMRCQVDEMTQQRNGKLGKEPSTSNLIPKLPTLSPKKLEKYFC